MLKLISKGNFQSIQQFSVIQQKKLGSGSFGTVKLALHNNTNRMYALKIISLSDLPSQAQIKLVQRQIKLHSEVDHPHIIKVWDTFADDSNIYMVMEYAEMGNLFYFQNTKNIFNEAEAFKFFCQTLSAVHYLHINDIIHRDLKPQNLLLDLYYNIKVCDFGWCTQNINAKRTTFCGTYEYMAPQMIFRSQYDYKVDIWALGILLYELLHGIAPFKGKSIQEVQQSMLKGSYQLNTNLSHNVKHLIQNVLQFKPSQRLSILQIYQHPWIKQMQQTLKVYLKEEKVFLPQEIQAKMSKIPLSLIKLKAKKLLKPTQKTHKFHRKNNSMNLESIDVENRQTAQEDQRNININLSINNFSISGKGKQKVIGNYNKKETNFIGNQTATTIKTKKGRHAYHSQDKPSQKSYQQFDSFKQAININQFQTSPKNKKLSKQGRNGLGLSHLNLKLKNTKINRTKNENNRCKTLVDEESHLPNGVYNMNYHQRTQSQQYQCEQIQHKCKKKNLNNLQQQQKEVFLQKTSSKIDMCNATISNKYKLKSNNTKNSQLKPRLKNRKSQQKIDKPQIRFNTQAYDKQQDSQQLENLFVKEMKQMKQFRQIKTKKQKQKSGLLNSRSAININTSVSVTGNNVPSMKKIKAINVSLAPPHNQTQNTIVSQSSKNLKSLLKPK